MKSDFRLVADPPPLSREAAHELLDFLHRLIATVEHDYLPSTDHASASRQSNQPDLFEDVDNSEPPF